MPGVAHAAAGYWATWREMSGRARHPMEPSRVGYMLATSTRSALTPATRREYACSPRAADAGVAKVASPRTGGTAEEAPEGEGRERNAVTTNRTENENERSSDNPPADPRAEEDAAIPASGARVSRQSERPTGQWRQHRGLERRRSRLWGRCTIGAKPGRRLARPRSAIEGEVRRTGADATPSVSGASSPEVLGWAGSKTRGWTLPARGGGAALARRHAGEADDARGDAAEGCGRGPRREHSADEADPADAVEEDLLDAAQSAEAAAGDLVREEDEAFDFGAGAGDGCWC